MIGVRFGIFCGKDLDASDDEALEEEGDEEPDAKVSEQVSDERKLTPTQMEDLVIQMKDNCAGLENGQECWDHLEMFIRTF